jgi:Methylase involved in ubiquinone/menaquinone biosynthesis
VEAVALQRLLNKPGNLMLELGAGAGRNTPRYADWQRVVLLDYSRSQLVQARERLGDSHRYIYVAADIYKLPFTAGLFDGATMIRTLHHMADPKLALENVRDVLAENAVFILEFANKQNIKAIARWLTGKQKWNPFTHEQVEFVELNFNFHPEAIRALLKETGFRLEKQLAVSFFRSNWFKNHVSHKRLVAMDSFLQPTGAWAQVTPSVFSRTIAKGSSPMPGENDFFRCPICAHPLPEAGSSQTCPGCGHAWEYCDGIYEFRIQPES